MEFESFITFVLFVLFFILPSVLKQIKKAREKKEVPKTKAASAGRQPAAAKILDFFAALDARVKRAKNTGQGQESIWDMLRGEAEADNVPVSSAEPPEAVVADPEIPPAAAPAAVVEDPPPPQEQQPAGPEIPFPDKKRRSRQYATGIKKHLPKKQLRFKKNALQNAGVLSEIIGRPVALKQEK